MRNLPLSEENKGGVDGKGREQVKGETVRRRGGRENCGWDVITILVTHLPAVLYLFLDSAPHDQFYPRPILPKLVSSPIAAVSCPQHQWTSTTGAQITLIIVSEWLTCPEADVLPSQHQHHCWALPPTPDDSHCSATALIKWQANRWVVNLPAGLLAPPGFCFHKTAWQPKFFHLIIIPVVSPSPV